MGSRSRCRPHPAHAPPPHLEDRRPDEPFLIPQHQWHGALHPDPGEEEQGQTAVVMEAGLGGLQGGRLTPELHRLQVVTRLPGPLGPNVVVGGRGDGAEHEPLADDDAQDEGEDAPHATAEQANAMPALGAGGVPTIAVLGRGRPVAVQCIAGFCPCVVR